MEWLFVLKVAVAITPVVVALFLFDRFDMFDLVSLRTLVLLTLAGAGLAAGSFFANTSVLDALPIGRSSYSMYAAPWVEEAIKGSLIIVLFAANRVGFKLDAAVIGFAVGAGFSIFENGYYLYHSPDANLGVWIVRGFGTAIMHGGATALFAVIAHEFNERQEAAKASLYRFNPLAYIPGWIVAALIHGTFNHFPNQPLPDMLGALLLIPMTVFLVFYSSEKATHQWLTADFENHQHALDEIRSGRFAESETGQRIARLAKGFRRTTAADIFDYIGLCTQMVLRAEEVLLDREAGKDPGFSQADLDNFARLHTLERSIGHAVRRALGPHLSFTRNDFWELRRLEEAAHAHYHGRSHGK